MSLLWMSAPLALILTRCVDAEYERLDTDEDHATSWRRSLQSQGAVDLDICKGPPTISARVGTLHDDHAPLSDGRAEHNGYGDNLNCVKTIIGPKGSTVTLQFSQIDLESGKICGKAHESVGCDVVEIYDGADINSPRLGIFSGDREPATIMSTGRYLTVRFETDTANHGLQVANKQAERRPGFYIDWHIVDKIVTRGFDICPASAVTLTDAHGTIHDDDTNGINCKTKSCGSGGCGKKGQKACADAGYKDDLSCVTTIKAPRDTQIRFTFTQMNLELEGCSPDAKNKGCPDGGCDFVAIYDGSSADSPLIGKYSGYSFGGSNLPSVVSSGNALRILFHTDFRNCGIANAEDPGWFADWDFVENGQVVGNDGPNDGKTNHLKSEAHGSGATQSDGGGTKSSTSLLLAGVGVAVAFGVLAAGFFARKSLGRKQVMPTDANAATYVFEVAGSVSGASERNMADNANNPMFGGFTVEAS